MKKIYITFGGKAYDSIIKKIVRSGPLEGGNVDEVWVYDDRWLIETGFVEQYKYLWGPETKHGYGGCCWKPYVIYDAMKRSNEGDLILYTDADVYPINDLTPIFDLCVKENIVIFEEQGCKNNNWIKRDCFIAMNCDMEKYHYAQHACGRFQVFANYYYVQGFIGQWLDYSTKKECMFHDQGTAPNLPGFRRHSTEQAVLSLLAQKWEIKLHRLPDQVGWPIVPGCGQPGDTYPQLFTHEGVDAHKGNTTGSKYFNVPGVPR